MVLGAHLGELACQSIDDLAGAVAATVVDHDDLVVEPSGIQVPNDLPRYSLDVAFFIESRKHDGKLGDHTLVVVAFCCLCHKMVARGLSL